MSSIKTLPEIVSRQIAAGEVVERPASVVKELVENAIDAGAGRISIRTLEGGVALIEVRDNGCGMSKDDVRLAPRNFSTSKISSADDLLRVSTFGFRGEALAAIAAVSRLDLASSEREGGEGWRITVEAGSIIRTGPAAHEKGTTARVENLFFNTPARKKFLKSELTERRRILETVLAFALARPDIEFHYAEDERPVLDLVVVSSWRQRIAAVMGGTTMKHMVETGAQEPPIRLKGFVSLPAYTRANRNHQFFYVNGRLVRERTLVHAVQEAYRSVVPAKRFPVIVLAVEVPFEDVDVNVHPTKLEVRLRDERRVFDLVRRCIKESLSGASEPKLAVSYLAGGSVADKPTTGSGPETGREGRLSQPTDESPGPDSAQAALFNRVGEPGDSDPYKSRVRAAVGSYMEGLKARHDFAPHLSLRSHATGEFAEEESVPARMPGREPEQVEDALFWQFNNTYIFIQVHKGLVVIDQHAAHERIIFDTSKRQMESEMPASQQVLFPITLELSIPELEIFKATSDIFHKLGFYLEPFGGKSILVRGYPQGLKNWEEGRLLLQIFDDLSNNRMPGSTEADKLIASFACRGAIKAGQRLGAAEMRMLADQLFAVENPYSCPHGRPTIYRLSLEDIQRWFARR
jgi:DNA mismatch repair protein MutL